MNMTKTKKDSLKELTRVTNELGKVPTKEQFRQYSRRDIATIAKQFGTWRNALKITIKVMGLYYFPTFKAHWAKYHGSAA